MAEATTATVRIDNSKCLNFAVKNSCVKVAEYRFNKETLRYEREDNIFKKIGVYFTLSLVLFAFGFGVAYYIFTSSGWFESPREKKLRTQLERVIAKYEELSKEVAYLNAKMEEIAFKDDSIYRVIFGVSPVDATLREGAYGGVEYARDVLDMPNNEIIASIEQKVTHLKRQVAIQQNSFDELLQVAQKWKEYWNHVPAIQPVDNKHLKRLASGFGYRIDPIYKVRKFHEGLDFSAPIGTPIYATGDGTVEKVKRSRRGYGNHVIINHGFGYKTLYAHMSKIIVKPGQKVKRGQIIGYVGNTGKSTAPHLHYEVWKNGKKVNPINYFFNDLTIDQYEEIVQRANSSKYSLD